MTPALARMKRAVRAGIALCGGIDGAGATAERSRSVAGDWNNLSHSAFPPLDCALAIDEVAVAQEKVPAILAKYAAELGHVCIRLPDAPHGSDRVTEAMIAASAEFGDVATVLRDATADGDINPAEKGTLVEQIDQAIASLSHMRALLVAPEVVPIRHGRGAV